MYDENEIFKLLFETEYIKFEPEEPERQKLAEEFIRKLNLPYKLEYFFNKWKEYIVYNTSRQSVDFIFMHEDIKKAIQLNTKTTGTLSKIEVKKKVYLTYFYAYLTTDSIIQGIDEKSFELKGNSLIIDKVFLTHILYRHFMHKQYVELTNNDGSLFFDETVTGRINKLKSFINKLNLLEEYIIPNELRTTICYSDNNNFFKIHLEKTGENKYRFITHYIVDKEEEIVKIKTLNKILLEKETIYF